MAVPLRKITSGAALPVEWHTWLARLQAPKVPPLCCVCSAVRLSGDGRNLHRQPRATCELIVHICALLSHGDCIACGMKPTPVSEHI